MSWVQNADDHLAFRRQMKNQRDQRGENKNGGGGEKLEKVVTKSK